MNRNKRLFLNKLFKDIKTNKPEQEIINNINATIWDLNDLDNENNSVLIVACKYGMQNVALAILDSKRDYWPNYYYYNAKNNTYTHALTVAFSKKMYSVVNKIIENGYYYLENMPVLLKSAIKQIEEYRLKNLAQPTINPQYFLNNRKRYFYNNGDLSPALVSAFIGEKFIDVDELKLSEFDRKILNCQFCIDKNGNGVNDAYLENSFNYFSFMVNEMPNGDIHSVMTFYHPDTQKNTIKVDVFCVNQPKGMKYGFTIINDLKQLCRKAGITAIYLDAVTSALPFYEKSDFRKTHQTSEGLHAMESIIAPKQSPINRPLAQIMPPIKESSSISTQSQLDATSIPTINESPKFGLSPDFENVSPKIGGNSENQIVIHLDKDGKDRVEGRLDMYYGSGGKYCSPSESARYFRNIPALQRKTKHGQRSLVTRRRKTSKRKARK